MYDGEVSFSSTALVCNLRKFCRVSLIVTAIVGGKLSPCESCQIQTMSSFSLKNCNECGMHGLISLTKYFLLNSLEMTE